MTVSNLFSLPSTAKSFTLSLNDFNSSILATWSNFYGPAVPNINNITIQGVSSGPYEGMLYRSSITNAFYVYDPTQAKSGGIGGGFTRSGIGSRNFESITALVANLSAIEQAELLTTVGDSTANYRVYVKTNNSSGFVDIGLPPASTLTSGMFVDRQISNVRLVSNTITGYEIAPYAISGDKLANNITYYSALTVDQNVHTNANVVFNNPNKGLRFYDGTVQNSAGMLNFANVGSGTSFVYNRSANGNLVMKTGATSLSLTGDSLGTGSFVINDSGGTLTFALTLGVGVGVSVGVGVGVGVGIGK